jgi:poly-gamma-glutamate capsule biosynthesis protein CapA/YwtB (metallophosphatase superfamily)
MAEQSRLKLMAVGDIGFIGEVSRNIDAYGPEHPFKYVEPILSQGDIIFGNLEKPFTKNQRPFSNYLSKSSIANTKGVDSLVHGHFNILSLGNNHILDFGGEGLADTIDLLDEKGIKYVGAGFNLTEARQPVIIEKRGIRVGFLAYARQSDNTAGKGKPGAAPLDYKNIISKDISELKKKVDVIVVSLHFGLMYTDYPTTEDREMAKRIIECGASLIIGHHPHVIQGFERYQNGVILYSLGEFIFDSRAGNVHVGWAENKRRETIILCGDLSRNGVLDFDVIPIVINDSCQPTIPEICIQERMSQRYENISREINILGRRKLNEHLGASFIRHHWQVFVFHLRRFNFLFILRKLFQFRKKHFVYFIGFILSRLRYSNPKR